MKYILPFLLLLFMFSSAQAQKGKKFPEIEGETLTGETLSVPTDTRDKITLVGVAYSKKSDEDLQSWFEPVYRTFIDPPQEIFVPVDEYDVHLYFIPMIRGIQQAADDAIIKKMKKNIDERLQKHVLVYKGAIGDYKKSLGLDWKNRPYFFVIDTNGKIIHKTEGAYDDLKLQAITELLQDNAK